jgi:hypothetical protein
LWLRQGTPGYEVKKCLANFVQPAVGYSGVSGARHRFRLGASPAGISQNEAVTVDHTEPRDRFRVDPLQDRLRFLRKIFSTSQSRSQNPALLYHCLLLGFQEFSFVYLEVEEADCGQEDQKDIKREKPDPDSRELAAKLK